MLARLCQEDTMSQTEESEGKGTTAPSTKLTSGARRGTKWRRPREMETRPTRRAVWSTYIRCDVMCVHRDGLNDIPQTTYWFSMYLDSVHRHPLICLYPLTLFALSNEWHTFGVQGRSVVILREATLLRRRSRDFPGWLAGIEVSSFQGTLGLRFSKSSYLNSSNIPWHLSPIQSW